MISEWQSLHFGNRSGRDDEIPQQAHEVLRVSHPSHSALPAYKRANMCQLHQAIYQYIVAHPRVLLSVECLKAQASGVDR